MKLGYLMVPRAEANGVPTRDTGRAQFARALGISEFYTVEPQDHAMAGQTLVSSPEQAEALRTCPELSEHRTPRVVAIDGKRQATFKPDIAANLTRPAVTPEHVKANARRRQATLSVSWLNTSDLAQHWSAHVSGSTHAGVRARPEDWRIARTILVCSDTARAEAAIKAKDSPCRAYYRKMAAPGTDIDALMDDCVLYGSLDTVLSGLDGIVNATSHFGTLTLVDHAWTDETLAQQSLAAISSALAPVKLRSRTAT
ncbi:MAG: hypothetical protein ABJR46_09755 [Tateyamaria sp.]|uniref:hypothetical protein n=1 Tax=Tateyamaria sp. TaxID=1929288 RepID=UPI0032A0AECF